LPGVDGRSAWMRRCKDIIAAHVSDLGSEDNISAAERSIIRRASVMTVELERLEAKFAAAGEASERDLEGPKLAQLRPLVVGWSTLCPVGCVKVPGCYTTTQFLPGVARGHAAAGLSLMGLA